MKNAVLENTASQDQQTRARLIQTAVELFSPPNSKWVKLSSEKMPLAKEKWKQELIRKKIPFEDYMLE